MKDRTQMINALTIDVEEYFHPTEVQASVDASRWPTLPSRLEDQILRILDQLAVHRVKATFFILGWIAEHHPEIVRRIADAGHEIACHSYWHRLVYDLTPEEFREDTRRAVAAIEDACGVTPRAYRAPSYSVTLKSMWALEVLVECGFTRDSSIYPIHHDRYGIPGFGRHAHMIETKSGPILEIPIATAKLGSGRVAPVGGGGYLRVLPYCYTAAGIRRMNRVEDLPACMYFHPWEIDPHLPRLSSGVLASMRTYLGLYGMEAKLKRLLDEFPFSTLSEVYPLPTTEVAAAETGSVPDHAAVADLRKKPSLVEVLGERERAIRSLV